MKAAAAAYPLTLWVLAMPVAAQTAQDDYRAGVAARLAGKPEAALTHLARAAAAEPENADVALQIGFADLALGRLDQAEAAFRQALELAPGYADARFGLALVAQRRGDPRAALAELAPVGPDHAEAEALRRRLQGEVAIADRRWRVDLDGSYSAIEGRPDWQSATLAIQRRTSDSTTAAATVETTRRFDRTDTYGEARIDYRFAPGSTVYGLVGGTPEADHRPKWQLGAGAAVRTHAGPYATVLRLDWREADYPSGEVRTVTPGVEQYLTGRAWVTGQWINVWDSSTHSSGWLARGDVMPTDRLRLFGGAANAPDLDEGVVIQTFSLFGGLSFDLDPRVTLRASLAHDDPDRSASRTTVALGLGYRF